MSARSVDFVSSLEREVPRKLRRIKGWNLWKTVEADGKERKVPFYANGKPRKGQLDGPKDRAQLVTFEEVAEAFRPDRYDGIGFCLGDYGDVWISGIDLDDCMVDGEPNPKAAKVIDKARSYCEVSPSGRGVHILGYGDIGDKGSDGSGLEIYSRGRFFTMTGKRLGTVEKLRELTGAAALSRKLFEVVRQGSVKGKLPESERPKLLDALKSLPNDLDRAKWMKLCLALKWALGEEGFEPWMEFSRKWHEFDEEYARERWRTAKPRGKVTADTIFRWALDAGWGGYVPSLADLRIPSAADIARKDIPKKVPLLEGLLTPGAWLVVGRSKVGKSWLLLDLAFTFAEGKTLFLSETFAGFACPQAGDVLYIAGEDDDERLKERMGALGYKEPPANVRIMNQTLLGEIAKKHAPHRSFIEFLADYLGEHPKIRMVCIDTESTVLTKWASYRTAAVKEPTRITDLDYKRSRDFDELALKRSVAIMLVNHTSKQKGRVIDVHELINTTAVKMAGASGSIVMADLPGADPFDPGLRKRILAVRGRDLRDEHMLAIENSKERPAYEVIGTYFDFCQTHAEEEILEAVLELQDMAPGEFVTTQEIGAHIDKKQGAVKKTITRMVKAGRTKWQRHMVSVRRGAGGGIRLIRIAGSKK